MRSRICRVEAKAGERSQRLTLTSHLEEAPPPRVRQLSSRRRIGSYPASSLAPWPPALVPIALESDESAEEHHGLLDRPPHAIIYRKTLPVTRQRRWRSSDR